MAKAIEAQEAQEAGGDTSADGFLDGRLSLLQPLQGARAGIDPVFLAASVAARSGERVLDVGAGVGVASLCLAARRPEARTWGLEAHGWLAQLLAQNIARNDLAGRVHGVQGDLFAPMQRLQEKGLAAAGFDHVMTNPPFHVPGGGSPPVGALRALAHVNPAGLERWLGRCCAFLRPGGCLSVIYPAGKVDELLAAVGRRLGGVSLFFLWAGAERPASRVICRGHLGSRAPLQVLPGLVLHEEDGGYTPQAQEVLRGGAAIALDSCKKDGA